MDTRGILTDLYGRVAELAPEVAGGLSEADLAHRPASLTGHGDPGNSIAWLVWHSARLQDVSLSQVAGPDLGEQVWTGRGWAEQFALDLAAGDMGYGHSSAQVDAVRAPADLLTGYHAEVADRVAQVPATFGDEDLDAVVDPSYDPPVTLAVRLVSVAADCHQHLGQAASLRGLLVG